MNLAQLMTAPAVTAAPDTPLPALLELMERRCISAVVLTDEEGRPLGLVTEQDITSSEAKVSRPAFSNTRRTAQPDSRARPVMHGAPCVRSGKARQ